MDQEEISRLKQLRAEMAEWRTEMATRVQAPHQPKEVDDLVRAHVAVAALDAVLADLR